MALKIGSASEGYKWNVLTAIKNIGGARQRNGLSAILMALTLNKRQRRRFDIIPYHVKDDGLLRKVGSGRSSSWELANIPTRAFEDFVIWKCQTCGKLLNSDVSQEHSYKVIESTIPGDDDVDSR